MPGKKSKYELYHHGEYFVKVAYGADPKLPPGLKMDKKRFIRIKKGRAFVRQGGGLIGYYDNAQGEEQSFALLREQIETVLSGSENIIWLPKLESDKESKS